MALYHRGHLLQSFLMTADVGIEGSAPTFVLEFSRSQRLTNLDDLGPRALSIAVNESPRAGHNLMIKTAGGALEVPFNANMVDKTVAATRTLLKDMKNVLPGPSKQTVPDPPRPTTDKALLDWWRKLAAHGQTAYRDLMAITGRSQEGLLDAITRSDDQVVQIARLDPGFVYPWPLLYDWVVPARDVGQLPPDVCFGDPDADGRRRCTHGKGADVICVYGFWAIRHQLDQVLTLGAARDPVRPVPQEPGAPQVRLAVGVSDKWTTELQTALAGVGNVGDLDVTDTATLIEALWRPEWRAPTIAVVAHHVDRDLAGEPPGSRLKLGNGSVFLSWERIADALQLKLSWTAPNSVVLLMACESGQATTARLDDFATLLTRAGAGAVVATELDIGTDLAARCARDVTTDLLDGATFGAALLRFHRRLAHVGNPFGFSFCWIGDAGLEVAHAG
ncbi:MAG TPA: CHAT domain-containing protein [Baekduia sp.]|nr:CHAT domain-containing protein [Baekduia sp.]